MAPLFVSVIIPVFNEGKGVLTVTQAVQEALGATPHTYEIILVNDGSCDDSWAYISQLSAHDSRIKGIQFSRNFGYQSALTAGYELARGDAIITMDADMQHPPALLPELLRVWQQGHSIVYAKRKERHDGFIKKFTAACYYFLLESISDVSIPRHVTDFKVISRQVQQELIKLKEKSRYLRGLVAWTGFDYATVEFVQPERAEGETKYSWMRLIKIAFDGIASFSIVPLKVAAFIGFFVIVTGMAMMLFIAIEALFFGGYYPLFKWLVTIIYIFMGVQFLLLWLIGEYIGRVFEQQKDRPLYIIKESLNMQDGL